MKQSTIIWLIKLHLVLLGRYLVGTYASSSISARSCNFVTAPSQMFFRSALPTFSACEAPTVFLPNSLVLGSRRRTGNSMLKPRTLTVSPFALQMSAIADRKTDQKTAKEKDQKREARKNRSSRPLQVVSVGLSHHNAQVEVREKLAVPEAEWNAVSAALVASSEHIMEAAILSTCNRFEVYIGAVDIFEAIRDVSKFLQDRSGLERNTLIRNLFFLSGEDAVWHLLRVSGGLDSLVVGEGQILSQVRACYTNGIAEDGSSGKVVSRLLNTAVSAGKRVRAETAISRGAVSISSAAAEFTEMQIENVLGKSMEDAKLCVVGAGKMTRLLVTHLSSHGHNNFILVNRGMESAERLAGEYPDVNFDIRLSDRLWESIEESDVVYTSTSSVGCIVTRDEMIERDFCAKRAGRQEGGEDGRNGRPLMLVDISVPRNVEPECDGLRVDGTNFDDDAEAGGSMVFAYNVDHLKAVVARNTAMRKRQVMEAEDLLQEESEKFDAWHQSLGAVPAINALQAKAESVRTAEIAKVSSKLSNLSEKEMDQVQRLTKGIVNKLLHGPMAHLRAPEGPDEKRRTLETLNSLFNLQ